MCILPLHLYYCSPMYIILICIYAWNTYIYIYIYIFFFIYNIYNIIDFLLHSQRVYFFFFYKSLSKCVQSLPPPPIADTIATARIIGSAVYLYKTFSDKLSHKKSTYVYILKYLHIRCIY